MVLVALNKKSLKLKYKRLCLSGLSSYCDYSLPQIRYNQKNTSVSKNVNCIKQNPEKSTVTKIGLVFENISSLAKTISRTFLSLFINVSGSNEPILLRVWLMKPTELLATPNRFITVEMASILHLPSGLKDKIWCNTSFSSTGLISEEDLLKIMGSTSSRLDIAL